jgi:hypothetical protein
MYSPVHQCTRCSAVSNDSGEHFSRQIRARTELGTANAERRPVDRELAMHTGELYRIPRLRPMDTDIVWVF